tara:strand:+ start:30 stop:224 length:195 start_codon:yes stop_codon:yes gene_type:complete
MQSHAQEAAFQRERDRKTALASLRATRILAAINAGATQTDIARAENVSRQMIQKIIARHRRRSA